MMVECHQPCPASEEKKMPQILLFHHAQGQTPGFLAFAEELRQVGHAVHTPDLYEGRTFDTLEEGVAHAQTVGFDTVIQRGRVAAAELSNALVYAGFSLGVMPAQMLAQTRPGAKGALLFHACVPISEFGSPWPETVPLQIHAMDADEFFVKDGDLDAARHLVETTKNAELYLYPGDKHLFVDASLHSYDKDAATLLKQRVLRFLESV
jgi:dienelactone hydrolase